MTIKATHTAFTTVITSSWLAALLFLILPSSVTAQTSNKSATDGITPLALAPGAPAGSYALSGFDNINPCNGGLNFRLPLKQVNGRGGAQHTMVLTIEQRWHVRHHYTVTEETDIPEFNRWSYLKPGYGPGVLVGRQVNNGTCVNSNFNSNSLTRLTFITPDGT